MENTRERSDFQYLSDHEGIILEQAAETILGVPIDQLGSEFLPEIDDYLYNSPEWLRNEYKLIFRIFNMKIMGLVFIGRLKNFTNMEIDQKTKYVINFACSRLPMIRSAFTGLKSICAWGYYSHESAFADFPGKTIGREHETPTLLYGKEAWKPR
ncbi:MAG: hypothetical protein ACFFE8_10745 [Candidatus Heimdallarchaeota archaeon]